MSPRILLPLAFVLLLTVTSKPSAAEEEHHSEHAFHRHHPGIFLGLTSVPNTTGFSFGAEYEFQISRTWGIGVLAEYTATSNNEFREWIFMPTAHLHYNRLRLNFGVGAEEEKIRVQEGHESLQLPRVASEEVETETGYVVRFGFEVQVPLGSNGFEMAPQLSFDKSKHNVKLVYGIAFSKGF